MKRLLLVYLLLLMAGCTDKSKLTTKDNDIWLIPKDKILNPNAEKDNIPSIDSPVFTDLKKTILQDSEWVYMYEIDTTVYIFPLSVLETHEIVNAVKNNFFYSVTYCPRTASAIIWNRNINGNVTEFGVSGMLYNENLMPYDRTTDSYWSQMLLKCVHGPLIGEQPVTFSMVKTRFSTIEKASFNGKVLKDNMTKLTKKVTVKDDAIHWYGIVEKETPALKQQVMLMKYDQFTDKNSIYKTHFGNMDLIIIGNKNQEFITSFLLTSETVNDTFRPVKNSFPLIMEDQRGNQFNIFGRIVNGPDKGKRLHNPVSFSAKKWAWDAFYPSLVFFLVK